MFCKKGARPASPALNPSFLIAVAKNKNFNEAYLY